MTNNNKLDYFFHPESMAVIGASKALNFFWRSLSARPVATGILAVAIASVVVKLLGAVKELAVANYFGVGDVVDAFVIAFLLPSFLINVLSRSFGSAVIPTYIRTRETEGERAASDLFSSLSSAADTALSDPVHSTTDGGNPGLSEKNA